MNVRHHLLRPLAALLLTATAALGVGMVDAQAAPGHPVPSKPLKTVTVKQRGYSYTLKIWARSSTRNCAAQAHGEVRHFLLEHRCAGLTRFLVTTTVDGRAVGFAQSSVAIPSHDMHDLYKYAGEFTRLVRRSGTGNFYSLFHSGFHTPSGPQYVPSPDAFVALSQDDGVTVDDIWYLHGPTPVNDRPLRVMARRIYLQWFA